MSAKIPQPNFTQVPNVILDSLPEFKGVELTVLLAITRKTFGWQKPKLQLSLTELAKITGCGRRSVVRAVDALVVCGWLKRFPNGQSFEYQLDVSGNDQCQNGTGAKIAPVLVPKLHQLEDPHIYSLKEKERKGDDPTSPDSPKEKPSKNPRLFSDLWCAAYKEFFGRKYQYANAKDGKACQRLLESDYSVDELIQIAKVQGPQRFDCLL